jgi:anaerobic selenocysteine-containing dehydrogenase
MQVLMEYSAEPDPAQYSFDARVSDDGIEQARELPVPVPDQIPCPAAARTPGRPRCAGTPPRAAPRSASPRCPETPTPARDGRCSPRSARTTSSNTTIYSNDDRYRGLKGLRTVVFINEADMADRGLAEFGIADYSTQSGQPVTKHLPVEITPAETTAEALEREKGKA